ncbi:MAG: DNA double-strand break repair nuclease NurA, partial [bacterium]|jgi:hypothetical protein|nr:DNA double-strand break repair nuclease NurA [bacterium]
LSDGSLIVWRLAGRALESYEEKIVLRYVESLSRFQTCGVPVAGYISQSGSREVVQLLTLVDQEKAKQFDPKLGLTDTALMSTVLQPGQRSIVFHSRSQILAWYGEQAISFFYLHVGSEVARIEIPRWLCTDPRLLDRVAAWCWFQARLAGGYPMILSEAHEHAVVRGPDREMFYALLEQSFLRQGIAPSPSPKQWSKRVPMV